MKNIVSFKNMNQMKKLLFIIIIVIILLILVWIFRIFRNNSDIKKHALVKDYNSVSSYVYFSTQGNITYDRQIYWDLNDIISEYINSVRYTTNEAAFTLANYYEALTPEYKLHLGEIGYNNLSNSFIEKFKINSAEEGNYKTHNIINEIYELPNNMYLCELNGTSDNKAYIGIVLYKNNKTFEIFYIE